MKNYRKNQRGMSLMEALVVLFIIGVALALVIVGIRSCMSGDSVEEHQLECIGRYSPGHGCRDQKLSVPQSGNMPIDP